MTSFSEYCSIFGICPIKAMNLLQEWGVVADECITSDDVAPVDTDISIRFCKLNSLDLKP